MNEKKQDNAGYKYLCHLEEAKKWMEYVLQETLPSAIYLETNLQNGAYLAKLGNFIAPDVLPLSRIYDIFQHRFRSVGLQLQHLDNINNWIKTLKSIDFPEMFIPQAEDVYHKKNMPKVIYCIHALSSYLFQLGQAPMMENMFGKINFSQQDIEFVLSEIQNKNIIMPAFEKIESLLTQELICDSSVSHVEILNINKAIDEGSEETLLKSLSSLFSKIGCVVPEYISQYFIALKAAKDVKVQASEIRYPNCNFNSDTDIKLLNLIEVQGHIRRINNIYIWQNIVTSIKSNNRESLKKIIEDNFSEIKTYIQQNIEFYIEEAFALNVDNFKSEKYRDAIQTILRKGNRNAQDLIRVSDIIPKVKQAVLSRDKDRLLTILRAPPLKLYTQVSDFAIPLYMEELNEDLKMSEDLNFKDIKNSIHLLNGIAKITWAIDKLDCDTAWVQLNSPDIPFMNVDPTLKTSYIEALHNRRQQKLILQGSENHLLTFNDIQECIDSTNIQHFKRSLASLHLEDINESVRVSNKKSLVSAMRELISSGILEDDADLYMNLFKKIMSQKHQNDGTELRPEDLETVINKVKILKAKALSICEMLWERNSFCRIMDNNFKDFEKENFPDQNINKFDETKENNISELNNWLICKVFEDIIIYVNLTEKTFKWSKPTELHGTQLRTFTLNDLRFLGSDHSNYKLKINSQKNFVLINSIIMLQAHVRGFVVRQKFRKIKRSVVCIQKWWRIRKLQSQEREKREKDMKVTKASCFHENYYSKKHSSFELMRNLVLQQKVNNHDYSVDLKMQEMKSCIVKTIKVNQDLANKLEEMDMKIGLLVQNRISVEALMTENKKLLVHHNNSTDSRGIKAFSKEAKKLLDGYQQLFYLLQTNPSYLTRLIVQLPLRSSHIIQGCVLSLFNYGSNSRDAFLLLRLFRSALFEEVKCKFQRPVDSITGNPLVLRLAIAFARQAEGHNPLKNILGFLIEKVLKDKIVLDINPLDIYRRWINQKETETGRPYLPHTITLEEALVHPEVIDRLNRNLRILKSWVKCFLDRLTHCVDQFPYALRFIAKLLNNALLQKFPSTPKKDILKIVGNLVYYQYINSAIVAPDAFYVITLPPNQPMKVEQRRNLACIAKILHFAATKKGFGEEFSYLMKLNPFIIDCHEEMKLFCQNCCDVEDLEEHFHVTKYTESTLIEKPRIYITCEEIRECHKLLLEVRQEVAPDPTDPIHEILDDLGPPPSLANLVGFGDPSASLPRAGKVQMSLELNNKFQGPPEDSTETERLFIRTKEMILGRMNDLKGNSLAAAINDSENSDIATNLRKLEEAGLLKSSDDYKDILDSLIKDLSDQHEYRRQQDREINMLRMTQHRLNEKKKFYENQLAYYQKYLQTCLSNVKVSCGKAKKKKGTSVKYTGTRLMEKGILVSLDGVPETHLKNVQFEISEATLNGTYTVHGRFMGVEVEKIEIDIQELLKFQFEGLCEINLFEKAQINVNLLIHLLNKKFHSRT